MVPLSLSLSLLYSSYNGHIYACFRVAIACQRYIGSLQSSWKVLSDTPGCILIFSASHLKLKRSSRILTDIDGPLLLTKYMQRLQIERRGGKRERERFVVSMEANGVATLSVQWRSTLASGLIIVEMSVSFDVTSIFQVRYK